MGDCQEWLGCRFQSGYGRITGGPNRGKRAHRVAWEGVHGAIPDGLLVLHHCDNPPCVNLGHLYLGTHEDNMRDRGARERTAHGQKINTNKLTETEIYEIRSLRDQGWLSRDIADAYGVSQVLVCMIGRRDTWRWLAEKEAA